jgi:xylose isomerase
MSGLNYAHAITQALWHGKLFHIDLNGQTGPRYDQDLRFGTGNARGAFWVVDALESGGYDGPVHFDYKPPRTEDDDGVWVSAAACMRNYLILRDKVRAFRSDPEVVAALAATRVDQLALRPWPTARRGGTSRTSCPMLPPWDSAGWRSSTSTSSRLSTSTARANRQRPPRRQLFP